MPVRVAVWHARGFVCILHSSLPGGRPSGAGLLCHPPTEAGRYVSHARSKILGPLQQGAADVIPARAPASEGGCRRHCP